MSETPRTDALWAQLSDQPLAAKLAQDWTRPFMELCRELERERDEWRGIADKRQHIFEEIEFALDGQHIEYATLPARVKARTEYAEALAAAARTFADEYRKEFYSGTEGPWSDPPDALDIAYQAVRAVLAKRGLQSQPNDISTTKE